MVQLLIAVVLAATIWIGGIKIVRASEGFNSLMHSSSSSSNLPVMSAYYACEIPASSNRIMIPMYAAEMPPNWKPGTIPPGAVVVPMYAAEMPGKISFPKVSDIIIKGHVSWRIPIDVITNKYRDLFINPRPNNFIDFPRVIELCNDWFINVDIGVKRYPDIVSEHSLLEYNFGNYPDLFVPIEE